MALISEEYREQNQLLHEQSEEYGSKGWKNVKAANLLISQYQCSTLLDYGCGKRGLEKGMKGSEVKIINYDPAIPAYNRDPAQADLVVCADVLEHIEPDCLDAVLAHIASKMLKVGLFVIACRKAKKELPDGRNTHLIVEEPSWWLRKIGEVFHVEWSKYQPEFCELRLVVTKLD